MLNLTSNKTNCHRIWMFLQKLISPPIPSVCAGRERQCNISVWSATYLNHCCVLLNNAQIMDRIKLVNTQQAATVYSYKNTKGKLHGTIAAIWFNIMYQLNHLTPKYINSPINLVCFCWYHCCIYSNNAWIVDHTKLILTSSLVPYGQTFPHVVCYSEFMLTFSYAARKFAVYKIIW